MRVEPKKNKRKEKKEEGKKRQKAKTKEMRERWLEKPIATFLFSPNKDVRL